MAHLDDPRPASLGLHQHAGGTSPAAATTFAEIGLHEVLLKALVEEGYLTPTPIQAQAVPVIMSGKDVLGCAQTGTGKTAAFALPILHRMLQQPVDKARRGAALPRVLVLSPTRELATQIAESFATYGRHTGFSHAIIFGGVSQFHQVKALHRGVDILVATPGRLIDLMQQRLVNLSQVGVFVLDEADRMLDMGFIRPIQQIAAALPKEAGRQRQTLLFSATMPREIMHLAESLLHHPVKISVTPVSSAAPQIEQELYHVHRLQKQALLTHLLDELDVQKGVVFTKTKHGADKVQKKLRAAGISSEAIHGNKAQNYRTRALASFRDGRARVLVATDVAARGLDVDDITHVFNFDLPMEPEAYVHRIGRTGRMGKKGLAISFCDSDERNLLRQVERLTGKKIPTKVLPPLPSLDQVVAEHAAKHEAWEQTHGGAGQGGGGGGGGHSRGGRGPSMRTQGDDHAPRRDRGPRSDRPAPRPSQQPAQPRTGDDATIFRGGQPRRDDDRRGGGPRQASRTNYAPRDDRAFQYGNDGGQRYNPYGGQGGGQGGGQASGQASGQGAGQGTGNREGFSVRPEFNPASPRRGGRPGGGGGGGGRPGPRGGSGGPRPGKPGGGSRSGPRGGQRGG